MYLQTHRGDAFSCSKFNSWLNIPFGILLIQLHNTLNMQEPSNYNSQKEFRKTITLIAGILLLFSGIFLLYIGTAAKGTVDFTTTLIKGKIETGSAGMLAMIAGFIITYLVIHDPKQKSRTADRISAIIRMLLNCNKLALIIGLIVIVLTLPLIFFLESIRLHLTCLIGIIIILIFFTERK